MFKIQNQLKGLVLFLSLILTSCATGKLISNSPGDDISKRPNEIPEFTIYALGDAGETNNQSKAVLEQLSLVTAGNQAPAMVIFLGDNIYPAGMPPEWNIEGYHRAQDILMNQINGLSSFKGEIVFIPGNHDWNGLKPGGLDFIRRESKFFDQLQKPNLSFIPENGCGGPVPLILDNDLVMLIIDSQWWINDWTNEPQINEGCGISSREEFIKSFREQVALYKDKQIVVAMHHPLYTQGTHGGHFSIKNHLFPLTGLVKWFYLPLPVLGSLYVYLRSGIGHPEDLKSPRYNSLRDALLKDLGYDGDLIFLAGHEHCLQYIRVDGDHFLVSGSGSKQTAIANSKDMVYGHKAAGFMELNFYKNNIVWLTVYEVNPETRASNVVLSRPIIESD
ncbi:MAG TPA: metallophosphoesterase [Saprospiraceae bacterium]|nr:metallophosphoesterase [Saprospiraceae bacterium]